LLVRRWRICAPTSAINNKRSNFRALIIEPLLGSQDAHAGLAIGGGDLVFLVHSELVAAGVVSRA
jgi:hypothetical protein